MKDYLSGKKLVKSWNEDLEAPKVYVLGNRIHHGEVAFLLCLLPALEKDAKLIGFCFALVEDDIDDIGIWFSGEKGDNSSKLIDFSYDSKMRIFVDEKL